MEILESNFRPNVPIIEADSIVIRFSGDSGDGMQLTGNQFTDTAAYLGNDLSTFPEFPAEIRAPIGTTAGVSGFQVHFGSKEIFTPGDEYDVLVAMNAAALKVDLPRLKKGGVIITNTAGFDKKNLNLAGFAEGVNPLENGSLDGYTVHKIDVTRFTKECLSGTSLGMKDIERCKNMFVLGLLFWMFDEPMEYTITFINEKFAKKPELAEANIKTLKAGWNFGDHTEMFTTRFKVAAAKLPKGVYRNISGNQATAIGLVAASELSGLAMFLGSYPITPASDILHELSKYKTNNVKTFQAEDEIAAVCAAIGASYAGGLGVTTTSGPGMSLKTEAIGMATMLEIPLLIVNVQRGGPSTGLPTKTEQSDLMMAMYGRHGEAPLPVIAASSPADCFNTILEASRIAIEYMTPVICLTDGYIANGTEPWRFPAAADLAPIKVNFTTEANGPDGKFLPYKRDERGVRPWVKPGTKGLMHRIGGLEKQNETGNVAYDAPNHELMTRLRAEKIEKIADTIPLIKPDSGNETGKMVVLGWGSTSGAIKTVVRELIDEGHDVAHVHLHHINPFPKNLGELLKGYDKILIPEMNSGQLINLIRAKYLLPAIGYSKMQGLPFTTVELKNKILEIIK
ncbi:2-oxoglutarate ferredoxin oxidoreductase subunit alpha [Flavipsychrobacter stenotrophus]|uniref:2-oxoglutarate ferredoxin oxidoreductase subunit alpha n=1 Tax=Flavipsychrobacter stenotrophus TaxID=2077091 RepID=A0A2S7SSR5_9BACT|nr:2-oxoacid:acceptor oxidoreductase subunit alpha [Flavipsychrobacter stenotrophus]PQJ09953.1 2-oxoglutarate ferredoxin oxidoreductase subunit alpha [Flavipsychrobacter stenotrophus]